LASKRTFHLQANNCIFKSQWEVNGQNQFGDMRIGDAWNAGYTGKGVVVSILDDGVDRKHKDLEQNYDPLASYDLNANDYGKSCIIRLCKNFLPFRSHSSHG
jgi:subtilisin family serine protease